jgi:hypothetical protein
MNSRNFLISSNSLSSNRSANHSAALGGWLRPNTQRTYELALQATELEAERTANLTEALKLIARSLATNLPVAYCRLLLATNDGKSLTVRAAHSAIADLQWKPNLGRTLALTQLPDGTSLPRLIFSSLIGDCRGSLGKQQLHSYSATLGLREPLKSLLLSPLQAGNKWLGALELGELERGRLAHLDEPIVHQMTFCARRLAHRIAELQHLETERNKRLAAHGAN